MFAVGALAGCGSSDDKTTATTGANKQPAASSAEVPEVKWAVNGKDVSLNVLAGPNLLNVGLMSNVADGLLAYESDGKLKPNLASEWSEVSPTVYSYTLKPDAKFSNGKPVTQEDVLFSMRFAMDPTRGAATAGFYNKVKSIDADGPDKIRVTLKSPDPNWQYVPGNYNGGIYEKASMVKFGDNFGSPQGIPVGAGPYKITEFASDHVTFERNPYYHGTAPKVQRMVVSFITDDSARLAAIQSGDIDGTLYVPLTSAPQWERVSSINILSTPSPSVAGISFNNSKPPFDDVHARRAMLYAFNREAVVEKVLHGHAQLTLAPVTPQMWASQLTVAEAEARESEMGPQYPFDLDKAREELAQSKNPDGFSTSIEYLGDSTDTLAFQVWQADLKKIGINLKLKQVTGAAQYEVALSGDFDMIGGSGGSFNAPDPLSIAGVTLCGCALPPNGLNFARYENPRFDELLGSYGSASSPEEAVDIAMEALTEMATDVPGPFTWFPENVVAVNKRLVLEDYGPWTLFATPWMANLKAAAS